MNGKKNSNKKLKIVIKKSKSNIIKKKLRQTYLKECSNDEANCLVIYPTTNSGRFGAKYCVKSETDYNELHSYCKENGFSLSVRYKNNLQRLVYDIDQKHKNQHKIKKEEIYDTIGSWMEKSHILEIQEKNRGSGYHIITDLVLDGRTEKDYDFTKFIYKKDI